MCSTFANRDVVRGEVAADAESFLVTEVVLERVGEVAVNDVISLPPQLDVSPGLAVAYVNVDGLVTELFPLSSDGRLLCLDSPMTGLGLTAKEVVDSGGGQSCSALADAAGYTQRPCDDTPEVTACALRSGGNAPQTVAWVLAGLLSAALLARRRLAV